MSFEQATIKVEREQEFGQLKGVVNRALGPETAEKFLKSLAGRKVRVRDWDAVLAKRLLENADGALAKSGITAENLYRLLTVSDQAQMREFYLSRIEEIEPRLRTKFHKLYQYY